MTIAFPIRKCSRFFPKADVALLHPSSQQAEASRPTDVHPTYDPERLNDHLEIFTTDVKASYYPPKRDPYAPSSIPEQHADPSRYLRAHLAENEPLRLSMLWYYTRNITDDAGLLAGLQEKVYLAQESSGWDCAIIGLLDLRLYTRLATVGTELGILPRGETLCAHTVNQPPGNVFLLPNMMEDWRFRESPYVEKGGLVAYAGVPLRMQYESGESVSLGTLCVASRTGQDPLSKQQQQTLVRLADCIVADIVQSHRAKRQTERHDLAKLVATLQNDDGHSDPEQAVLDILRVAYPNESISIQPFISVDIHTLEPASAPLWDSRDGLWEDTAYIADFIANSNHCELPTDRAVRSISASCESKLGPSKLVVATTDFRHIFDDVDSWFVQTCANILSQKWQAFVLSEATVAKERFLRGMSHQLRTPIHGILGAAELLTHDLKNLSLAPQFSDYVDTILNAGQELMCTVNSLITLNRWADVARADRQYALHSLTELETELANCLSLAFTSGTIITDTPVFFFHDPKDRSDLRIDISIFKESLLPLIINAVQNTTEGVVIVTLSTRVADDLLVIDIEDTGRGIRPADQKRVFQLYEKVDEHTAGAGLGLTLATKFSALVHGSIELISSHANGSHFRATFRNVDYQNSQLVPPIARNTEFAGPKIHYLPSGADNVTQSPRLIDFLNTIGYSVSTQDPTGCILILDYVPDLDERRKYYSRIPIGHTGVCLVPPLVATDSLDAAPNITYIESPFSTSKILRALEVDDRGYVGYGRVSSDCQNAPLTSALSAAIGSSKPTIDDELDSDEGYGSNDATPSSISGPAEVDGGCANSNPCFVESPDPKEISGGSLDKSSPGPTALTKPRALLVDDNAVNLRILQMYCKKRGLEYCTATDGRQAVDIFAEQKRQSVLGTVAPIDLILMDLQMPVCDGIEATQEIRRLEEEHSWERSILMIVTGQDSPADREAASNAGADDYVVKPFGPKQLDRRLNSFFSAIEIT